MTVEEAPLDVLAFTANSLSFLFVVLLFSGRQISDIHLYDVTL